MVPFPMVGFGFDRIYGCLPLGFFLLCSHDVMYFADGPLKIDQYLWPKEDNHFGWSESHYQRIGGTSPRSPSINTIAVLTHPLDHNC